jgi:hypothetical protein
MSACVGLSIDRHIVSSAEMRSRRSRGQSNNPTIDTAMHGAGASTAMKKPEP